MAITVTSMTGFARAGGRIEGTVPLAWVWEAKSVNGKNLEARVRVPTGYDSLEIPVRAVVSEIFSRGSINLTLQVAQETTTREVFIDEALLDSLIALAHRKADALGKAVEPARLDGLMALAQSRAASDAPDADALKVRDGALLAGARQALADLAVARRQEGEKLAPVISGHLETIATLCAEAGALATTQPDALKARLLQQIAALAGSTPALSPERLAQETVLLAVKFDIREELDRLAAHVSQARELLDKREPCGRRLDFLSQEFNREANTVCSKAAEVALTRVGLALKTAIDQFREQIQNIE